MDLPAAAFSVASESGPATCFASFVEAALCAYTKGPAAPAISIAGHVGRAAALAFRLPHRSKPRLRFRAYSAKTRWRALCEQSDAMDESYHELAGVPTSGCADVAAPERPVPAIPGVLVSGCNHQSTVAS